MKLMFMLIIVSLNVLIIRIKSNGYRQENTVNDDLKHEKTKNYKFEDRCKTVVLNRYDV